VEAADARLNAATLAMLPHGTRDAELEEGWTRATPLGAFLREVFGKWVYWSGLPPYGDVREVPLSIQEHRSHPGWCPRCQVMHEAPLPPGIRRGFTGGPQPLIEFW